MLAYALVLLEFFAYAYCITMVTVIHRITQTKCTYNIYFLNGLILEFIVRFESRENSHDSIQFY